MATWSRRADILVQHLSAGPSSDGSCDNQMRVKFISFVALRTILWIKNHD
ncbi:hypothetical protein GA0061100_105162 [Rhizobium hainanense]|uniref:Uncharacterized protein n=1 Tax=Rhizobium hainanense TaxID=52131 RepID=A0A1C3VB21_9HYPH|nr:hypothetical protein GA0061100_105162 [Rhizobium hainanense]